MSTKKEINEEYFIQIGLKRNGRIVKNESLDLCEFNSILIDASVFKGPSLWQRICNLWSSTMDNTLLDYRLEFITSTHRAITGMIDADGFGKKSRTKKKKA